MADDPNSPLYPTYQLIKRTTEDLAFENSRVNPRLHVLLRLQRELQDLNDRIYAHRRAQGNAAWVKEKAKQYGPMVARGAFSAISTLVTISAMGFFNGVNQRVNENVNAWPSDSQHPSWPLEPDDFLIDMDGWPVDLDGWQ